MRAPLLIGLFFVGCRGAETAPPTITVPPQIASAPVASSAQPAVVRNLPLVVNNRLVDARDGKVVGNVDGVAAYGQAVPSGPHRYRFGEREVDTATGVTRAIPPPAALIGAKDKDWQILELVRNEPDGRVRWKIPVRGARSVRPPDVAVGGGRVVAAVDSSIFAFDDGTGAKAWQAAGPADRLSTDGKLLFTTDCSVHGAPRWLVGRNMDDGKEVFKSELPADLDPSIAIDDAHVVVFDSMRDRDVTVVFDHAGKKLFQLAEVPAGTLASDQPFRPIGQDLFIVSDKRIARIDSAGNTRWERKPPENTFVPSNEIVELEGGDLLVANSCAIADSGVHVLRLKPSDGSTVWEAHIRGLGVAHSKYSHVAYAEVRGDRVFVVSQGSYGSFFERVALASGARELRCVMNDAGGTCAPP